MQSQVSQQLANRFREVVYSGDWVAATNFKMQLSDLTMEQATRKNGNFNTIAALTFHIHYYIAGILNVLKGGTLDIRDKYSYDMPPVETDVSWQDMIEQFFKDAELFVALVEKLSDEQLQADFTNPKYGNYQRNIDAMIEHCYYHLGQIVLLKKMF